MPMTTTAKKPKISQQRIARDLGLSQALVSMVLNGRTEGISEDSYRRIWEHALGLGYQPKGMRALASGDATKQIHVGFILRSGLTLHTQSSFFSQIQHGLHEALQERGISMLFLGTEEKLNETSFRTTMETRKSLLGAVVMGEVKPAFLKQIKSLCPRLVAVSISYPGQCHSVQSNETQSLDLLVEHLAELGHKRFGWLGGNRTLQRHEDRYRAFRAALHARGLGFDENWAVLQDSTDRQEGRAAGEQFLAKRGKRPTALVCFNALMARGAINVFEARGLDIPADLSVAAIDATRVCKEEDPQITGASADPEAMGRKTADLLLGASGTPDEVYLDAALPSRLTVRATTAAPVA